MEFNTPIQLLNAYTNGYNGAICDPEDTERLLAELPMPLFGAASGGLYGSGDGKLSLPFKAIMKFVPQFGSTERQVVGDCVSHATRNAVDITRAVEIIVNKEKEDFVTRGATEGIYGSRGHSGEGMTCSGAARFVNKTGGILLRQKYGKYDLSVYNGKLGASWGGVGTPNELVETAKKNQVQTISSINSIQEAKDALANGYALSVCSNYGFSSKRDNNGIANRQGSWGHAMAWIACDDTKTRLNETLFLIQNSWGVWNAGPKVNDQPDGSFWIREEDAAGMLSQGGAWVFSSVNGFPPRKLSWSISEVF